MALRLRSGEVVRGSAVVGADGVRSAVARHLKLTLPSWVKGGRSGGFGRGAVGQGVAGGTVDEQTDIL